MGAGGCVVTLDIDTELAGVRLVVTRPGFETGPLCAVSGPSDIALNEKEQKEFCDISTVYNHPKMTSCVFYTYSCMSKRLDNLPENRQVRSTHLSHQTAIYAFA